LTTPWQAMLVLNRSGGGYRAKHMQKCKRDFVKSGGLRLLSKPGEQFLHPTGRPLLDRDRLRLAVHRTRCS
jgi:hypothetical protein